MKRALAMTDRELMQQALEALEISSDYSTKHTAETYYTPLIQTLRERLAQPEQEPVAGEYATCLEDGERVLIASVLPVGYGGNKTRTVRVVWPDGMDGVYTMFQFARLFSPVGELTTPPRREWVGLTEEEKLIANQMWRVMDADGFIEAIEAKLKEKNA